MGPFSRRKGEGAEVDGPALGLIETSSIARGHVVADQMVKKAPVALVMARPVSPGKFLVLVSGEIADVDEAMKIGRVTADSTLVDQLELAQVAVAVLQALAGTRADEDPDHALGIVETYAVAGALLGADAACKTADVGLPILRLADGIGGKAYFVVAGAQSDVEAALFAAVAIIPAGLLHSRELIARPHPDLVAALALRHT